MKEQLLEQFLQGKLELNCPLIILSPCLKYSKAKELSGSGVLSFNENGYFDLKVLFKESFPFDNILKGHGAKAGKLIGKKIQYTLKAFDISENIWYAESFIPIKKSCQNGSMILSNIPELHLIQGTNIKKNYLKMYFNELIDLPLNTYLDEEKKIGKDVIQKSSRICMAKFSAIGIDITIDNSNRYTVLKVESKTIELSDLLINRFLEAFQFVTAYPYSWSALEIRRNGKIEYKFRGVKINKAKSNMLRPISYRSIINESVWKLFEYYLTFISKNEVDFYHPIAILVQSINDSSNISLESKALTLSVSIETIIISELKYLYKKNKESEISFNCASKLISNSNELDPITKKRILGSITSLNGPKAKSILLVLSDYKLIKKTFITEYNEIRNKAAHGASNSGTDIQTYLNQTHSILVLFYQLVFLIIRYKGEYTDYSTYGYKKRKFVKQLPKKIEAKNPDL